MKKLLTLAVIAAFSLSGFSQEEKAPSQVRAFGSGLSPVEWGPYDVYFGGGFGLSAPLGKRWVLNGDIAWYGKDFPAGVGYIERNIFDFRGSIDFYFSEAFKGFYVGALMGYTDMSSEPQDGATLTDDPKGFVPLGFQLGFNTALSTDFDLNIKAAYGGTPGGPGAVTLNMGIGYKF